MKSRRPLQSFRRDSETATTTCTAFLHQRTKPNQSLCNQNRLRGCTGCRLGEAATPRNPKRGRWSNRRAAETPMHPSESKQRHGQLANPPPPALAKGSMRDMVVADPTTYARPPISTGFDYALDGARWRSVAISEKTRLPLPTCGIGVVDLRPHHAMAAGRLFRHAVKEGKRIIRMTACEHKAGMCKCPYDRFMLYQDDESSWQPWV